MFVLGKNGLSPVDGSPYPMWSGITEEDAKQYVAPINNTVLYEPNKENS